MSAVNMAEVLSKLTEIGEDPDDVTKELERRGLLGGKLAVFPLTAADAVVIANLQRKTKRMGSPWLIVPASDWRFASGSRP